jgi:cysteinyl-tRNA synthetase
VTEIVQLIEELIQSGHAYEAAGDVYFAVRSFPEYGRLSNQRTDQLREGGDTEGGEHKRDPLDFALWKATKADEDTSWDSPWGRGRPGWHIECSAMSERWLGREFAVHGGGRDLVFPHHENEIAQSQAAGRRFAHLWAHNGMLRLGGEKMSKSVGNIEPLHVALDRWGPETLILFFLRGTYGAPIDFTDEALEQARRAAETLRNKLRDGTGGTDDALREAVAQALDEDFNTPRALALLFDAPPEASGTVAEVLGVLGLGALAEEEAPPDELVEKARMRDEARAARDFARSDALRDEILAAGWEIRDTPDGAVLYRR